MSSSGETFVSARGYSRITKLPKQLRNFRSGKLLNNQNHPNTRSETVLARSTSASMFKLWKWEILSCVLAIGMLGSMLGILRRYDGQRIPDWGTVINLSTLIALMATILRAMLAFVVAEIIGQAKWKYFAGGGRFEEDAPMRRLIETTRFNDASQGPLGAVQLIPTITRDPATLLAVMVMVISLGTGSFVQQAIQTQSCQFTVHGAHASLPISRAISTMEGKVHNIDNPQAALSSALYPDNEEIGSPISVGCPTGNCTFQNSIGGLYSTLGVCSLCDDTSSLITSTEWTLTGGLDEEFTANYSLPNGMSSQAILTVFGNDTNIPERFQTGDLLMTPQLGLDWAGDLVSSDLKALNQWAFANFTVLTPNWLPTSSGYPEYAAVTCTVYPCLRSYNATVISGKLDEVLVSTVPTAPNMVDMFTPNTTTEAVQEALSGYDMEVYLRSGSSFFQAVQSPCLVNNTIWTKENISSTLDLQPLLLVHADSEPGGAHRFRIENTTAPAECLYSLWPTAVYELSTIAGSSFNGTCGTLWSGVENTEKFPFVIDCDKTYWLGSFLTENGTTAASITKRVEDFTDRFSNKLRMGLLGEPEAVSGQVQQTTVCSRIDYSWLTFPAVLVTVTSGLLAWTMFQSSRRRGREMVWKTSILPFLFYGERFVVQNGEDMSGQSTESSRRDGPKEPLLDLDRMEAEAKQQIVRFDVLN